MDATVLFVGQGVLADALAKRVACEGIELERAKVDRAAQLAHVAVPELVVLAGDAAADGGKRVIGEMGGEREVGELPILVICGPVLATLGGVTLRKNVAALAPEGGLDLCAQRIRSLVADLADSGLSGRALQHVVDGLGQPAGDAQKAPVAQPQKPARRGTLVGIAPPIAPGASEAAKAQPKSPPAAEAKRPARESKTTTAAKPRLAVTQPGFAAVPERKAAAAEVAKRAAPSAEASPAPALEPKRATPDVSTAAANAEPKAAAEVAPAAVAEPKPAVTEPKPAVAEPKPAAAEPKPAAASVTETAAAASSAAADDFEALDDDAEPLPKIPPLLKSQPPPAAAPEPRPSAEAKPAFAAPPVPSIKPNPGDPAFARTLIAAPVPSIKPALTPSAATTFAAPAPAPALSPAPASLAPEVDVRLSEDPPADAHTPLSWTTPAREPSASDPVALPDSAFPAPRRFPIKPIGGAVILAAAAAALLLLRGAPDTAPPAAVTGSVAATANPPTAPAAPQPSPSAAPSPAPAAPSATPTASARVEPAAPEPEAAQDEDDDGAPAGIRPELREKLARVNRLVEDGHRLLKLGHYGLAEAAYLKALAQLPDYPRAMAGLARVHIQRKDGAEAVRWAKRLVAAQPRRGNNQLLLGDAWALRGNMTLARAAWQTSSLYGNTTARKRLAASGQPR